MVPLAQEASALAFLQHVRVSNSQRRAEHLHPRPSAVIAGCCIMGWCVWNGDEARGRRLILLHLLAQAATGWTDRKHWNLHVAKRVWCPSRTSIAC